ncbi:hypothetical protein PENCOP_c001G01769 [Penicillium coprophilum]|uniref:Uncharacterized protein n=1 Tax=Penicillium coprophilum TaxID=36646 RepID=A0A1V6V6I3_9EURO|nr:hypothetical protein PENCOP_c001G01769 [Penicillium coprophilum]
MASKRSSRSTDYSLGLLNNINALGRDVPNIQNPKRRRTNVNVFDVPISPSPTKSGKSPQTDLKITRWSKLRNRTMPGLAQPDPHPGVSDNEGDQEHSNDESGSGDHESESIQDGFGSSEEEQLADFSDEAQPEPEHDPFPEPVDLFPAEDEDQADHQVVHESREAPDDTPRDGFENDEEEDVNNRAGKEVRDAQDNASEGEPEYGEGEEEEEEKEAEADDQAGGEVKDTQAVAPEDGSEYADDDSSLEIQNHPTAPQQVADANILEVQILESLPRNQRDSTPMDRVSENARNSRNASSQLQEVPETPTIQPSRPDQGTQSTRPNIFTWLTETTKESAFKDTWEAIRKTRKTLKAHADPSTKGHFRDIMKLIERLRKLFETMTNDPASASFSRNQCSLIANSIFKENQWIIYTEAPEDEEYGAHLVNQLEAHVVPRLIDLIILGFKTYKIIHDQGARHFRIILDLIWGSCDRISSLAQMNYVISGSVMAHSRRLVHHVKTLKDALKDGRLREIPHRVHRRPLPYRHFELEEVDSHISCGRWTYAEKIALRDGLQLYEGEDRYINIKCDNTIGGRLSDRILQHIQSQALKLGDDL